MQAPHAGRAHRRPRGRHVRQGRRRPDSTDRPTWPRAPPSPRRTPARAPAPASAVDGFPTNEPFWGAGGSPNAQDWYEVNFGTARTVNEVRLYFKDSRPASTTYRRAVVVQHPVPATAAPGPPWATRSRRPAARGPTTTWCSSPPVTTQRIRVLITNASGAKTGLTEFKVVQPGRRSTRTQPIRQPGPVGDAVGSYTSAVGELRGHQRRRSSRPVSNDHGPNPGRWGTWPNSGQQWAQLTWPSAQTLNRAQVYFFDDNQGIDMPSSWTLQYWNGSAYVDVAGRERLPDRGQPVQHASRSPR